MLVFQNQIEESLRRAEGLTETPVTTIAIFTTTKVNSTVQTTKPTTPQFLATTPKGEQDYCRFDLIGKLTKLADKLDKKIDILNKQNKDNEAIILTDKLHHVLVLKKSLESSYQDIKNIVDQAEKIEQTSL